MSGFINPRWVQIEGYSRKVGCLLFRDPNTSLQSTYIIWFCCCSSSFMSYVAKMMECSGAIWRHHLLPSPNSILTHFNSTSIFRPMKMATLNIRSIDII